MLHEAKTKATEAFEDALSAALTEAVDREQYYTPTLEEIFVGYEYQYYGTDIVKTDRPGYMFQFGYDNKPHRWRDEVIVAFDGIALLGEPNEHVFRVPYLTRAQIENEGWQWEATDPLADYYHGDGSVQLTHFIHEKRVCIFCGPKYDLENLFNGYCPSINELRKVWRLVRPEQNTPDSPAISAPAPQA